MAATPLNGVFGARVIARDVYDPCAPRSRLDRRQPVHDIVRIGADATVAIPGDGERGRQDEQRGIGLIMRSANRDPGADPTSRPGLLPPRWGFGSHRPRRRRRGGPDLPRQNAPQMTRIPNSRRRSRSVRLWKDSGGTHGQRFFMRQASTSARQILGVASTVAHRLLK